jgi:hypothetical protein
VVFVDLVATEPVPAEEENVESIAKDISDSDNNSDEQNDEKPLILF